MRGSVGAWDSGSLLPVPPNMARDRPRRCPRQQVQQPRCPSCSKRFTNILRHLNHRQSKCANWLNTTTPRYNSSSHHHEDPTEEWTDTPILDNFPSPPDQQSHAQRVEFPGASKTYGQMKTFMERFDDDQYSEFRTANIHYPFAGEDEWELGSFLLSSGLSMKKIDDFLRLKMVNSPDFASHCTDQSYHPDSGCWCLVLHSEGPPWQGRVAPQSPRVESQEDQPHRLCDPRANVLILP